MTMPQKYRVTVLIHTLEPGTHISRETISRRISRQIILTADDCCEPRPDWGQWFPVASPDKAARTLRARGYMPPLSRDEEYYIGMEPC